MITLADLRMAFGTQVLFENVTWQLQPAGHYGLVGANGTGKSTLLKMMAGELSPEGGTVSRPNDLALGTLGQDHFRYDTQRLLDVVISGRPRLHDALTEKHAVLEHLEHETDPARLEADGHKLAHLEAEIADMDGYTAEAQAAELLAGLGLPEPRHVRPMAELSGGYRLRVLLARTLFAEPQLLLLDEPTNHLDIDSIRWLETYLRAFTGCFVVVSHDRHFLNVVCTTIADVDYGELRLYPGNYDAFMAAKALAVTQKDTEIARAEDKIAEMQKFIDRFKAKATKARQAQSRKKQVERMEMPEIKRSSRRYPAFGFTMNRPSGREVLAVEGVTKAYDGHRVLEGVGFTVQRGERLAVVGPNGIGKSTLLKIISGRLDSDSGVMRLGYEAHLGYFAQDHHELLTGRSSVYQWLHALAPGESIGTIRGILGRVLFSGDEADKSVADLSGGESARLLLAALMLAKDNLLVLDEPTNHLDLEGREALMNALREYEGTLIFVSHDRHFVSHVAERVLVLHPGGVEDIHGSYEDYLARQGEDFLAVSSPVNTRKEASSARRGKGEASQQDTSASKGDGKAGQYQSQKARKRELAKLEKRVSRLEGDIAAIEAEMADKEASFGEEGYFERTPWEDVQRDQQSQQERRKKLQSVMAEWEKAAAELDRMRQVS